jgi:hypothetical protein
MAIVGRNKNALKDTLVNIGSEARKRGLRINENKTKYMEGTRAQVIVITCVVENMNLST